MAANEENISILRDSQNREVALQGVNICARLHQRIAEVEVVQSYVNASQKNIETIYTFPLPIGAVLLSLDVEIAGKKLSGHVVERQRAERDYEDAITDGNSAVMLQETGPGLYTASIGNLMPAETAVIKYRYALMLRWQGTKVRFLLPTTIAPRYGHAQAHGMQPHLVRTSSLTAQYPLKLRVVVEGELAASVITCLTHPIAFEKQPDALAITLANGAVLDRDFVLTLAADVAQSSCSYVQDGDEFIAAASMRIPPVAPSSATSLGVKLVIDCSGSMAGTSIAQARKAALEILHALSPNDRFNVSLFGDEIEHLFPTMVPATPPFLSKAVNRLEFLEADMGGTEMQAALLSTFALQGAENTPSVLLITDGEIEAQEMMLRCAKTCAHRIFTVGVGSAVVDVFLESLARTTGGACELVSPQEGMAEKILTQFHRLRQPQLEQAQMQWPCAPEWSTALPQTLFAGDTVHVFAGFKQAVDGVITLHTALAGTPMSVSADATLSTEAELPRIAAAHRMKNATPAQALALALQYQLLSPFTSYLVVAHRKVQANDLPVLHQVPQMLAADWGGTGGLAFSRCSAPDIDMAGSISFLRKQGHTVSSPSPHNDCFDDLDLPFGGYSEVMNVSPRQWIEQLKDAAMFGHQVVKLPLSLAELDRLGLDKCLSDKLWQHSASGIAQTELVVAFLYALTESVVGVLFDRNLKRLILKRWKEVRPSQVLNQDMQHALANIVADHWDKLVRVA